MIQRYLRDPSHRTGVLFRDSLTALSRILEARDGAERELIRRGEDPEKIYALRNPGSALEQDEEEEEEEEL